MKKFLAILLAILLVLTVFGSIWDFEIASAIYIGQTPSENLFGILFSYIGIIQPLSAGAFLEQVLLAYQKNR